MTEPIGGSRSPVDYYADYALKHDVMTDEEEAWVGRWILEEYTWAQDHMIVSNLRFVVYVANGLKRCGTPLEDKIQDGNYGLIKAARKFDYRMGFRFNSYAVHWVQSEIERKWERTDGVVTMPASSRTSRKEARKIMNSYYNEHGHDMGVVEFMEAAGITETAAIAMLSAKQKPVSLDAEPAHGGDDRTGMDKLVSDKEDARITEGKALSSVVIERATADQDGRVSDVLRMRYGLAPYVGEHTLGDVGRKYGISRERARQIQETGFLEIRRSTRLACFVKECKEVMAEANKSGLILERRRGAA